MAEEPLEKLVPMRARFVDEYVKDLNGTQACIRAGYSSNGADVQAVRLLGDARVKEAIDRRLATRAARVGVQADEVLEELHILATACVEHFVVDDDGYLRAAPDAPEGVMRAVQSIDRKKRIYYRGKGDEREIDYVEYEIKFKLWDKPGQLKLLGRHAGVKAMFDRVEVSGPDGGPIPISEVQSVIVDPKEQT